MKRTNIMFIVLAAAIALTMILATVLAGSGIWGTNPTQKPGVTQLELTLPEGYSISSFATYHDTLVLCCWNESLFGTPSAFCLLSYRLGDASFSVHPIVIVPYEGLRTSLQVVDDKLYLFHTKAYGGEYTSYRSYIEQVYTNNWTLGVQKQLNLPSLLAPGVEVSDGENLYIIGGRTSNTTPPYWPTQANDTIFRVNVATGESQTVALVPGASGMHCLFLGGDLLMFRGGFNGGSQTNYVSSVDWNSTVFYSLENKTLEVPEGLGSLSSWGALPACDDESAYFFNPLTFNGTSNQWNYTREVWRMDGNGAQAIVNVTLPEGMEYVVPIRLGNGFFLINPTLKSTSFWYCVLGEK